MGGQIINPSGFWTKIGMDVLYITVLERVLLKPVHCKDQKHPQHHLHIPRPIVLIIIHQNNLKFIILNLS